MDSKSQDVAAAIEQLRSQDIDVVRVSYSDMIGIDRGRDVLLSELPAALGHGLPFSRCVYHTSPMGDVVPIQGGCVDLEGVIQQLAQINRFLQPGHLGVILLHRDNLVDVLEIVGQGLQLLQHGLLFGN